MNRRATGIALVALAIATPVATAHHDVATTIALLSARIEGGEESAEVFYRRATEYRVIRELDLAEADLRRALEADADFVPARRELARLLKNRGETPAAIEAAEAAVASATEPAARAVSMVLLARLLSDDGDPPAALHACESALALRPDGEVEWFLLHAELLAANGRLADCPAALKDGHDRNGSVVLRNAWIDALLDAGETADALPIIETELSSSRLKSSWLLRRARARLADGDDAGAKGDLAACITELDGRIHPARPDVTLVADRGLAKALSGDHAAARADLARARAAGADRWVTAALERALEGDG